MSRTTLNIDTPLLRELKRLQEREGRTMGELVSELLAEALAIRREGAVPRRADLEWFSKPMKARVDLEDKEALYALLDEDEKSPP